MSVLRDLERRTFGASIPSHAPCMTPGAWDGCEWGRDCVCRPIQEAFKTPAAGGAGGPGEGGRHMGSAQAPQAAGGASDPIVEAVRADLLRRSAKGRAKYGTTLARSDVSLRGWLSHAYEEALDLALYLRRAMDDSPADDGAMGLGERGA